MTLQRLSVPVMALLLCGAVSGCSRESKEQQPVTTTTGSKTSTAPASGAAAKEQGVALVRVVNAAPDVKTVDVMAKDNDAFRGVAYKTVTEYRKVPTDADTFAIKAAGQQTAEPLAENRESIASGRHYTLVVFPDKENHDKADLKVISDEQVPPEEGKARIRVINASPDVTAIAANIRGQKDQLFSGVDFRDAAAYKEVAPGKATIELRLSKSGVTSDVPDAATAKLGEATNAKVGPTPVLTTARVNLEAGKSYTIVLAGHTAASGRGATHTDGLNAIIVEDTVPPEPAQTE